MNSETILKRIPKAIVEQPYEIFVSVLLIISAVPILFGIGNPRALHEFASATWIIYWWAGFASLGSLLIIIGVVIASNAKEFSRIYRGHNIEKLGLIGQGFSAIFYGVAGVVVVGNSIAVGAALLIMIGIINLIRYLTLTGSIQMLKRATSPRKE